MKGEAFISKSEHADNIGPAIFGGFILAKSVSPLQILEIPSPEDLYATIIHPQIEIKTADARALLPKEVSLQDAIKQWANLGGLIHGLHASDYDVIKSSLQDVIVEPHRSTLIPYFDDVKKAALGAGALGSGISGSGPSIFSLSNGKEIAMNVKDAIEKIYSKTGIEFDIHVSKINNKGIKILN